MQFQGQRVKQVRWIHGRSCVVRVEVEAVYPVDDPSEPCFEPETVEFLRQVQARVEAGDIDWLRNVGQVYTRVPA